MTTSVARVQKEQVLDSLKGTVQASTVLFFVDFRGLPVSELTTLRRSLRQEGGSLGVYKNTLTRRALDELSISYPGDFLIGPSAMIHTSGDAVKMAKALVKFAKGTERLTIKGGILDGGVLDTASVNALAELPSREELLARFVGSLQSPLRRLVGSLSSPARGLVYVLSAIKDQK